MAMHMACLGWWWMHTHGYGSGYVHGCSLAWGRNCRPQGDRGGCRSYAEASLLRDGRPTD